MSFALKQSELPGDKNLIAATCPDRGGRLSDLLTEINFSLEV